MKLCIDCRHYFKSHCYNKQNSRLSPVTGEQEPRLTPDYLRDCGNYCGPTAKWFEPKEPAVAVPLKGSAA